MSDINEYYRMIESCISRLGLKPETVRGQNQGSWVLVKGSAKIYIDCWFIENEGRAYFQVMSPIMQIPQEKKESFYFDLLSFNDKLYSCAFALFKDWAWIKMVRECDDLDEEEAFAIITRVGHYADQYDDLLKEHYSEASSTEANADGSGGR